MFLYSVDGIILILRRNMGGQYCFVFAKIIAVYFVPDKPLDPFQSALNNALDIGS